MYEWGDVMGEHIFISTVFIAGILSFFAPCTFPLLPVYIGTLTDKKQQGTPLKLGSVSVNLAPIGKTLVFVGGLSTSFMILGFGAGALGGLINSRWILTMGGMLVVLLGIHQLGIFKLNVLNRYKVFNVKRSRTHDLLGTYLLGVTFSFGWTPCVGPVLGAVLVVSAGGGQAVYGALLMLIYTLGLAIPFMIVAVLSDFLLDQFVKVEKHLETIKKVGGVLIIIMGLLLMTENLNGLTAIFESVINGF